MSKPFNMKKLIIQSGALKQAFVKLGQAIEANPVLPVRKNLLCRITPGQAELIASSSDITIYYRIPCEAKEEFEFLVTYHLLKSIISLVGDLPLTIEVGKNVSLSTGADNFDLKVGEKVTDFPKIPAVTKKAAFSIGAEILSSLTTATNTCSSVADSKLRYVLMDLEPGKITVASSDGNYCIYSREFQIDQKEIAEDKLLISQSVIKIMHGIKEAKIYYTNKNIFFYTDQITVISVRSEEKYVDYRAAFPAEWPANLKLEKAGLMLALEKCQLSTDLLFTTTIGLNEKVLEFDADDPFLNIHAAIPAEYSGQTDQIVVNSAKLAIMLKQIDSQEIELAIHERNKPIVITGVNETGYKGMLMPISSSHKQKK